jgi:hypothetical protein
MTCDPILDRNNRRVGFICDMGERHEIVDVNGKKWYILALILNSKTEIQET